MNQNELKKSLSKLPLGDIRYFDSIGSTNDEALAWAATDAPDLSLVIADEQTAGRGRLDRKWFTPKGTALAFSLILRPTAAERPHLSRTVGLAALAVADSLRTRGLAAQIKWPNDILISMDARWRDPDRIGLVWRRCGLHGDRHRDQCAERVRPTCRYAAFPCHQPRSTNWDQAPDREEILHDILAIVHRPPPAPGHGCIHRFVGKAARISRRDRCRSKLGDERLHYRER